MLQHVANEHSTCALAAEATKTPTYFDDVCIGSSFLERALALQTELIIFLELENFELRECSGNDQRLLARFPESHLNTGARSFEANSRDDLRVLGLRCNQNLDCFHFCVEVFSNCCTKKNFLQQWQEYFIR